jgi:hypothetical protein
MLMSPSYSGFSRDQIGTIVGGSSGDVVQIPTVSGSGAGVLN